jgi:hypothetical protein
MLLVLTLLCAQDLPPEFASPIERRAGGEYVLWWLRRGYVPPVLTTGPPGSTGVLGQPGTSVVYGDERLETRHGDRFCGGRFFLERTDRTGWGAELRAFFLERDSTYRTIDPVPTLLALAYTDAATGLPTSEVVAGNSPTRGPLVGGFVGYSRIELFGQEANAILPVSDGPWKIDLLGGGRFLQMRDRYHHTATNRNAAPALGFDTGAVLTGVIDNIRVANQFYGAQVGVRAEADLGRFWLQGRATAALGADCQRYRAWGERTFHTPAARVVTPGGLFVNAGNSGEYSRINLDAVGEVALNAGWRVTERIELFVGYTFLLWLDPIRAGDQVETVVGRPGVKFDGDSLWAQGFNVGLQLRW